MTREQIISALFQHDFATQAAELKAATTRAHEQMALAMAASFVDGYARGVSRFTLFCDARGQAQALHKLKMLELLDRGIMQRLAELEARKAG